VPVKIGALEFTGLGSSRTLADIFKETTISSLIHKNTWEALLEVFTGKLGSNRHRANDA
jgi:hypothetical protein